MAEADPNLLELVLACYRKPLTYQNRLAPSAPLPAGMDQVLWLANGSPEILEVASRQTGARAEELREAARFVLQQWCFIRSANHYRTLGLEPEATPEQIKEHHRLLIRLFHPDRGASRANWTDQYASRVNEAWTVLSRPSARADYDVRLRQSPEQNLVPTAASTSPKQNGRTRKRRTHRPHSRFTRLRRWWAGLALSGLALAAALLVGGVHLLGPPAAPTLTAFSGPKVESESPVSSPDDPAVAEPADHSAIAMLLATPDWQALERREQQTRQRVAQARETQVRLEPAGQNRRMADEVLLERLRAERIQAEERLRAEHAQSEQVWAERLTAEQARLERLRIEQARIEQAQVERVASDLRRREALQAEQAQAEPVAAAARTERMPREQRRTESNRPPERITVAIPEKAPGAADAGELTMRELEDLINRYSSAYQRGDLTRLMALFAPGARGKGGTSRAGIQLDYEALFSTHLVRRMELSDVRWQRHGSTASATARYALWLRQRSNGDQIQLTGAIRFTAIRQEGRILLEAIDYEWPGR